MYTHIHSHQHAPVHTLPCMAPCESSHTYFCAWFLTHLRACGPCACRAGERSRGAPGLAGNGHSGGSPGHAPVSKFLSQPSPILALPGLGEHHGSLVWGPWQRNEQNYQHAHEKLTRQKQLGRSFVCWGWGRHGVGRLASSRQLQDGSWCLPLLHRSSPPAARLPAPKAGPSIWDCPRPVAAASPAPSLSAGARLVVVTPLLAHGISVWLTGARPPSPAAAFASQPRALQQWWGLLGDRDGGTLGRGAGTEQPFVAAPLPPWTSMAGLGRGCSFSIELLLPPPPPRPSTGL